MSDRAEHEKWRTTRYQAYVWWCQDEMCDCTQPLIDKITPNTTAGYPWIHREAIWEGEFVADTWELSPEEREIRQYAPLREACGVHGVPIPDDLVVRVAHPDHEPTGHGLPTPTGDTQT